MCIRDSLRRDLSAGEGSRAVAVEPANVRPHIHADDVAFLQHPMIGDTVDDHVVDADAGAGWIAVVMQERGNCALLADTVLHRVIDLLGCYAGLYHFPCQSTGSRGN